jgi:DNA-3-methyladenine glycosylase II
MVSNDLNFLEALVYLCKKDKILEKVIKEIKPKEPEKREPNFEALVRIISGQQLSSAAASTIFNRLKEFIGKNEITPQLINNCNPQQILKCGLSNAKTQYILNLSDLFLAEPNILNELKDKESNEIIEGLQKFKGIGIWSASIFALFYLNHPDVFAWGDISIKKAIRLLYEEDEEMENERIIEITSKWTPYRSTACIVLWKWLDEGAIKFS